MPPTTQIFFEWQVQPLGPRILSPMAVMKPKPTILGMISGEILTWLKSLVLAVAWMPFSISVSNLHFNHRLCDFGNPNELVYLYNAYMYMYIYIYIYVRSIIVAGTLLLRTQRMCSYSNGFLEKV